MWAICIIVVILLQNNNRAAFHCYRLLRHITACQHHDQHIQSKYCRFLKVCLIWVHIFSLRKSDQQAQFFILYISDGIFTLSLKITDFNKTFNFFKTIQKWYLFAVKLGYNNRFSYLLYIAPAKLSIMSVASHSSIKKCAWFIITAKNLMYLTKYRSFPNNSSKCSYFERTLKNNLENIASNL